MKNSIFSLLVLLISSFAYSEGFVAGTLVKTPTGYTAIQNIKIGDLVLSCDFEDNCVERAVLATHQEESDSYMEVLVGGQVIGVGAAHLFYTPSSDSWIEASKLKSSTVLMNANYEDLTVQGVRVIDAPATLYNISVDEHHNYYVSEADVLVHNQWMGVRQNIGRGYGGGGYGGGYGGRAGGDDVRGIRAARDRMDQANQRREYERRRRSTGYVPPQPEPPSAPVQIPPPPPVQQAPKPAEKIEPVVSAKKPVDPEELRACLTDALADAFSKSAGSLAENAYQGAANRAEYEQRLRQRYAERADRLYAYKSGSPSMRAYADIKLTPGYEKALGIQSFTVNDAITSEAAAAVNQLMAIAIWREQNNPGRLLGGFTINQALVNATDGLFSRAYYFLDIARDVIDMGLGFVPVVGDVKDLCEAVTGWKSCIPGTTASTRDRLFAGAGVVIGTKGIWKHSVETLEKMAKASYPGKMLCRGSTGRDVPNNLIEQLAMEQAMRNPTEGDWIKVKNGMKDSRWHHEQGWEKYRQNINGIEVHYVKNKITGEVDDFKFKDIEK